MDILESNKKIDTDILNLLESHDLMIENEMSDIKTDRQYSNQQQLNTKRNKIGTYQPSLNTKQKRIKEKLRYIRPFFFVFVCVCCFFFPKKSIIKCLFQLKTNRNASKKQKNQKTKKTNPQNKTKYTHSMLTKSVSDGKEIMPLDIQVYVVI